MTAAYIPFDTGTHALHTMQEALLVVYRTCMMYISTEFQLKSGYPVV